MYEKTILPAASENVRAAQNAYATGRVPFLSLVEAQRSAVTLRPAFPEAWNELGFALRNQGRYPESLQAYDEALRLRPNFPEALEYLGEAYVKLGRLDDARRVLDRLRPLDRGRAQELAEVIEKGK